ncbi:hypothetical protein [Anaerorhabdus sp.]|uniref:hypothetical protein n=1 Tax=Anaerorhabdus sp. TaxID=1872524 RepID=UPI002FCA8303
MKKNIFYLSILIILISFLFAIPVIDKISVSRTYSYISSYDEAGFERVGVIIENNNSLQSVDNYTYYSFLDDCAIKNNLVIYILTSGFSKETNDMQNNIYLSTNDLFLKDRLLLYSGYADNLNENNSYTTYNNGNSRLLSFNYPYQTSVSTIHHYNEKGKYINLISVSVTLKQM